MASATYKVEVDWDNDGDFGDANEDITADVKSISYSRGKDEELGKASPGTLQIRVTNSDGKYSPTLNTGIYTDLLPKRVIKVTTTAPATYNLFYGYIETITPHPDPASQDCYISAIDGLDFLARHELDTVLRKSQITGYLADRILDDAGWTKNYPESGLVLYLPLPEMVGTSLVSIDDNEHTITLTGTSWTPTGRSFNGSTDEILCGTDASLIFTTGDFSLVIWAYLDTIGSHRVMFGGNTLDAPHLFSRSNEAVLLSKPSTANAGAADTAMPEDTWACVGCSFDNSEATSNLIYYRNGVADGTVNFDQDFADYLNSIGVGNNAGSWHWSGSLGEVWIYNRILTSVEMLSIYNATSWRY